MMRQWIAWWRCIGGIELERFRAGDERLSGGSLRRGSCNGEGHSNQSQQDSIHDLPPLRHAIGMRHLLRMDGQYAIARVWVAVGLASSIMVGFGRGTGKATALPVKRRLPPPTLDVRRCGQLITAASRLRCHAHSK